MKQRIRDPLHWIWVFLIMGSLLFGLISFWTQPKPLLEDILQSTFELSKVAFEISIGLTGILCLWMGIMNIGQQAGVLRGFTRMLQPLFSKIFPDIPKNHPALGSITLNLAANMLGLDNAATPAGLKAMKEMQTLNDSPATATNAQILFLVINTSSVTLIPVTIFAYRAQQGAASPTDVFIPLLLSTFASTLVGFMGVAWMQKIKVWDRVIALYLGGLCSLIALIVWFFMGKSPEVIAAQSATLSSFILLSVIALFMMVGLKNRINVYDAFIEGAKGGFQVAITIIPYLVAMLVAIGMFRASGALDFILDGVRWSLEMAQLPTDFVDALPTAFMKPLSGSGARGMMFETMKQFGADSFVGRMACVFQGSTETTFYVLAVYFGAVGIKKSRYAAPCALLADAAGIVTAIFVTYWFFGG
jgi:spore maturation protein SpmA